MIFTILDQGFFYLRVFSVINRIWPSNLASTETNLASTKTLLYNSQRLAISYIRSENNTYVTQICF